MRLRQFSLAFFLAAAGHAATEPQSTVDWLLEGAAPATRPALAPTTSPASQPATFPAPATAPAPATGSPLVSRSQPEGARQGVITLSDGTRLQGVISTTPGKPIRVWQEELHKYADLPLAAIDRLDAVVLWEREEKEWHFMASGSDLKEYTGRSYPARETEYVVKVGEETIKGGIVAPIAIETAGGERNLVLYKRDKGPLGASLKDLVYIKSIEFGPP